MNEQWINNSTYQVYWKLFKFVMPLIIRTSSILNLLLALPVGSCACERSFSSLRRLKTWSRSTVGEQRLNGLSLLFVHRDSVSVLDRLNILRRCDSDPHRIALAFSEKDEWLGCESRPLFHFDYMTLSVIKLSCLIIHNNCLHTSTALSLRSQDSK